MTRGKTRALLRLPPPLLQLIVFHWLALSINRVRTSCSSVFLIICTWTMENEPAAGGLAVVQLDV